MLAIFRLRGIRDIPARVESICEVMIDPAVLTAKCMDPKETIRLLSEPATRCVNSSMSRALIACGGPIQ